MIRIAVMQDKNRIIGATDPLENEKRFPLLPKQLPQAMGQLYQGENIAGGVSSWKMPTSQAKNKRYVITRDVNFDVQGEPIEIITDAQILADKYKDSEEELLIVGGKAMFDFFSPYAHQIDIAESNNLIPGDVVYDAWMQENLELTKTVEWEGFKVLTYTRK